MTVLPFPRRRGDESSAYALGEVTVFRCGHDIDRWLVSHTSASGDSSSVIGTYRSFEDADIAARLIVVRAMDTVGRPA